MIGYTTCSNQPETLLDDPLILQKGNPRLCARLTPFFRCAFSQLLSEQRRLACDEVLLPHACIRHLSVTHPMNERRFSSCQRTD